MIKPGDQVQARRPGSTIHGRVYLVLDPCGVDDSDWITLVLGPQGVKLLAPLGLQVEASLRRSKRIA